MMLLIISALGITTHVNLDLVERGQSNANMLLDNINAGTVECDDDQSESERRICENTRG